jgi:hypothetical protein
VIDALTLQRTDLDRTNMVELYRMKTGKALVIEIPAEVADTLSEGRVGKVGLSRVGANSIQSGWHQAGQ